MDIVKRDNRADTLDILEAGFYIVISTKNLLNDQDLDEPLVYLTLAVVIKLSILTARGARTSGSSASGRTMERETSIGVWISSSEVVSSSTIVKVTRPPEVLGLD
jgi:hypothetical protein